MNNKFLAKILNVTYKDHFYDIVFSPNPILTYNQAKKMTEARNTIETRDTNRSITIKHPDNPEYKLTITFMGDQDLTNMRGRTVRNVYVMNYTGYCEEKKKLLNNLHGQYKFNIDNLIIEDT